MKSSKKTDNKTRKVIDMAAPVVDRLAQAVGVAYILATSYAFTHDWLKTHQFNHDYSLVGGILVVSVALYLIVRKR